MKRKTLSVLAIVFLGLFIALALFQLVFWRQLFRIWGALGFYDLDSVKFPIPWRTVVYIAAAVTEIFLTAKGKNRRAAAAAAVPAAAWLLGTIMYYVQYKVVEDKAYLFAVSRLNTGFLYVRHIFMIGAALAFIAAFAGGTPKKFLSVGTVCVSVAAAAVIILLFPISVYKVIYASGFLISVILLIITAVRKSKVLAVVSGVFYALHTVLNFYVRDVIYFFIAQLSGSDELTAFSVWTNYIYYAGGVLFVGAVMILSYCAAYAGNTKSTFEKTEKVFESGWEGAL